MKVQVSVALFIIVSAASLAHGQKATEPALSLTIGISPVALGMTETAARQALRDYTLPPPGSGTYIVWTPEKPTRLAGSVSFDAGRVARVTAVRSYNSQRDFDFADTLSATLLPLNAAVGCDISVSELKQSAADSKIIRIECAAAGRGAMIYVVRGRSYPVNSNQVRIEQVIFQPRRK